MSGDSFVKWRAIILMVLLAYAAFGGSFSCHFHSGDGTTHSN
jgi:hypothetical protein